MRVQRFVAAAAILTGVVLGGAFAQDAAPRVDRRWLDSTVTAGERARASESIGKAPPDFPSAMRAIGEPFSLDDLLGRVVVVQFWTRGDRRGVVRLDQLAALQKKVGDDLAVVSVHLQRQAEGLEQYLSRRPVSMPVLVDEAGAYAEALGVSSSLANIVIDRAGVVRHVLLNPLGIESAVEQLVAEPAPTRMEEDSAPARPQITTPPGGKRSGARGRAGGGFWTERIPDERFPTTDVDASRAINLLGKPGPAIEVEEWLTETPNATDKVVIVDFWATWCGPCIKMIPHMNEIQEKHRDAVVVMGVSDEPADRVRAWLPGKGMRYAVGVDTGRSMMQAVQPRGIPYVIVYSPDGVIRWQGHPARLTDDVLGGIVQASRKGR